MADAQPAAASRVPLPSRDAMNEGQRAIYDQAMRFFGAPIGPRIVFLETPEVGIAWTNLLATLQKSALPKNVWELAILVVARDWNSQFEWWAHEGPALAAGIGPEIVADIKAGRTPRFAREDEAATFAYVTELYRDRKVSTGTYDRLRGAIGSRQLVELTVLIGHYNSVAMTLAAHEVQLPPGVEPPLPPIPRT